MVTIIDTITVNTISDTITIITISDTITIITISDTITIIAIVGFLFNGLGFDFLGQTKSLEQISTLLSALESTRLGQWDPLLGFKLDISISLRTCANHACRHWKGSPQCQPGTSQTLGPKGTRNPQPKPEIHAVKGFRV